MAAAASAILFAIQAVLLLCLVCHYVFVLASIRQPATAAAPSEARTRFAIAIPAHDEALVLKATLSCFQRQAYPSTMFDVHVVADHCTDDTAAVAWQGGAIVHERDSMPGGRKAYALQWLLKRILDDDRTYDAVAVFDADSLVDPGFLRAMDGHLLAGRQVLQGQHIVSNPEDSLLAALAAVDMRLNNRLRNQSRRNLGLACRLMGDAMVFDARVLRRYGWPAESVTEDREYGYELLLRGIRAWYVPEARSHGQAASRWKQAEPQRLRWYVGVGGMRRRLARQLLSGALRSRSVAMLDGLLELMMPSYSTLTAFSVLNLGLVLFLHYAVPAVRSLLGVWGSTALLAAWVIYPFAGLTVDRAPLWAFKALALGPAYLVWRLWVSVLVWLRGDRITWIRTRRREESDGVSS